MDLDTTMAITAFDQFFSGQWVLYAREVDRSFSICDFGDNHAAHVKKWMRTHRKTGNRRRLGQRVRAKLCTDLSVRGGRFRASHRRN